MRERLVRRHRSAVPYSLYATPVRPAFVSSFRVDVETMAGRYTILRPVGELESATVSAFRQGVAELGSARLVIVDLARVPFVDSCGIGALIGAVRRVRDLGGNVAVAGARPAVRRVLDLTGFDRIVELAHTVDEALAVLSPRPDQDADDHPVAI